MHMQRKNDLNSAEMENVRVSRNPTKVITANGEVQKKNKESTVCVKDLDLFVTVHLLEDTPPFLSLGKLCEHHGYSFGWTMKNGRKIPCNMQNYVPIVVPGLSSGAEFQHSTAANCLFITGLNARTILRRDQ